MAASMRGDMLHPDCPARLVLDRVGGKWTAPILRALADGPVRFNTLRARIGGISHKMLSETLKSLERDGLVTRTVIPSLPVTVEYSTTPLAQGLALVFTELADWAEENMTYILAARERHASARG